MSRIVPIAIAMRMSSLLFSEATRGEGIGGDYFGTKCVLDGRHLFCAARNKGMTCLILPE